jgi:hypothetical protein
MACANHYFNGVNPFGDLDPTARVWKTSTTGVPQKVQILLNNAALASQAVGPANSHVEMSWNGRNFPELGRKLLALRPLADQQVAVDDSVLGRYRDPSGAVCGSPTQPMRRSFVPHSCPRGGQQLSPLPTGTRKWKPISRSSGAVNHALRSDTGFQ